MRLWSLHPVHLDAKGLVALWREGLLAQKVLQGKTKGYQNHPQLIRFKEHTSSLQAIANYLHAVCDEADRRGYSFDREKILMNKAPRLSRIPLNKGQLAYEFEHLKKKLAIRDKIRYDQLQGLKQVEPHPLFILKSGGIASWEIVKEE